MILVTLALNARIRREDHVRADLADGARNGTFELVIFVKAAVAEIEKDRLAGAEPRRGGARLRLSKSGEFVGTQIRSVPAAKAPVEADQKKDFLAGSRELRSQSARADLNIVRMRTDEKITLKALQFGKRHCEMQCRFGETHASFAALRSAISAQIRSYSSSSSL